MHDVRIEPGRIAADVARIINDKINEVARCERHDFKKGGRIRARAAGENGHSIAQHIHRDGSAIERLIFAANRMHTARRDREAQDRRRCGLPERIARWIARVHMDLSGSRNCKAGVHCHPSCVHNQRGDNGIIWIIPSLKRRCTCPTVGMDQSCCEQSRRGGRRKIVSQPQGAPKRTRKCDRTRTEFVRNKRIVDIELRACRCERNESCDKLENKFDGYCGG